MAGNAEQLCADWYGPYNPKSTTNPTGPATGQYHVLRGGSWADDEVTYAPDHFRTAHRDTDAPGFAHDVVGFRCVWPAK
jgi:formylglycine-generating enzyme required for sulfatase activity